VEMAHAMGVSVEAELGRLVTGEAGSKEEAGPALKAEDFYTDPAEAEAFCKETGVDALAIAFGTAHGFYTAQPKLDFDVVKNVAKATGLPLVMHGGSGLTDEDYRTAIACGIRKINYYTYQALAGGRGIYETVAAQPQGLYFHDAAVAATNAMREDVTRILRVFGGEG